MKKNQYNKEGNKEGYWEYYLATGKLHSKGNYINGLRDGLWTSYYDEERLDCIANFKNGKREGYTEGYFYAKEKLAYKGHLSNNEEIGYWEFYNLNGELSSKEYYLVD
jgi:antitoxin component YwqK of YwqJK toxin-antitoxin module